jgi:hypothetical protein
MDIKGFSQLLKKRRQYYIESSIATIDIDKKNIDEVVDWIKNNEKNHFNVICSCNGIWIYFKC